MTLEGGKNRAPPPDPAMAMAAASQAAMSARQVALAEKQYADYTAPGGDREWARQSAEDYLNIAKQTAASAEKLSTEQLESMRFNDKRYKDVAIPYEDQLLKDSERFDSQGYKDGQVASAVADVKSASDNVRAQKTRGMGRMGINPSSGNAEAMRGEMDMNEAAVIAGTSNNTRRSADQVGLATKMQMYGGMKGLAGLGNANASLATGALGLGLNAGGAGVNAVKSSLDANNNAFNTSMSGMTAGIHGLGSAVNSYGKIGELAQNAAKINNANDPFASILGAGAKMGAAFL